MAPSKQTAAGKTEAPAADATNVGDAQAGAVASAVVDDNGQVTPDSPQAQPVAGIRVGALDRRQYSNAGEGYQPGEAAPSDTFLDLKTDKVVTKAPERGQALTIKGSPVEPWAARLLAEKHFKG
jgi:hypothetical protein